MTEITLPTEGSFKQATELSQQEMEKVLGGYGILAQSTAQSAAKEPHVDWINILSVSRGVDR